MQAPSLAPEVLKIKIKIQTPRMIFGSQEQGIYIDSSFTIQSQTCACDR
jgi:hypothetical protein